MANHKLLIDTLPLDPLPLSLLLPTCLDLRDKNLRVKQCLSCLVLVTHTIAEDLQQYITDGQAKAIAEEELEVFFREMDKGERPLPSKLTTVVKMLAGTIRIRLINPLRAVPDDKLLKKVLSFAGKMVFRKPWRGQYYEPMVKGYEPADLVQEAFQQLLEQERDKKGVWPRTNEYLLKVLCRLISGQLKRLVSCAENRVTTREEHELSQVLQFPDNKYRPDVSLQSQEGAAAIARHLEGDREAQQVAKVIIDYDLWKPQDIAGKLNTTVGEINKTQKRMRRRLTRLQQIQNCEYRVFTRHKVKDQSVPVTITWGSGSKYRCVRAVLCNYSASGLGIAVEDGEVTLPQVGDIVSVRLCCADSRDNNHLQQLAAVNSNFLVRWKTRTKAMGLLLYNSNANS